MWRICPLQSVLQPAFCGQKPGRERFWAGWEVGRADARVGLSWGILSEALVGRRRRVARPGACGQPRPSVWLAGRPPLPRAPTPRWQAPGAALYYHLRYLW